MGDEGRKGRVDDRFAPFPTQNHGLFGVVQALRRHTAEMGKSILVAADKRMYLAKRGGRNRIVSASSE